MSVNKPGRRFRDSSAALWTCIIASTAGWICIGVPVATALNITDTAITSAIGGIDGLLGIATGAVIAHVWSQS